VVLSICNGTSDSNLKNNFIGNEYGIYLTSHAYILLSWQGWSTEEDETEERMEGKAARRIQ